MNRSHPLAVPTPGRRQRSDCLRPLATLAVTLTLTPGGGVVAAPNAVAQRLGNARTTIITPTSTVDNTLRVLARLHEFGYTINTPARADRAIRHWQAANGLTVDGIVGPETMSSLNLPSGPATASAPAVRDNLPPGPPDLSVEQIIRDVWPDELEDRAVAIATRESRLQPAVRNACCWGLFQIHWAAHRSWLAELGINSASQLLDARTNATAALALYERDGWQPWSL